jgi:ubiquinone biosynthesis protein
MVSTLSSLSRLIRSGLVLLKHDALIPVEVSDQLPPIWRFPANVLRALFAQKGTKKGPKLRVGMRYAAAFEQLGPAFIKLGQVLSTRADIFGDEFTDDLRHLKDQLPPFPKSVAEVAVATALEKPVDQLFIEFGEVIGAASIAQAHRAVLKDGRTVAVKILRPGIEDTIARDTAMMRLVAKMVHTLSPASRRLEPQAFVEAVARSLQLELDLRLEASAADELGKIINEESFMSAPAVVWSYVSKRVMVTEWARGVALSRPDALTQPGIERKAMADNLIRAFLSQALNHGVFHADLHEGNLFCEAPDKLIAIDFGIIGRLKPKERRYLAEMLWGFLQRDYKRVAEVHFEAGYVPKHQDVDTFAQALRAVGEPVLGLAATDVSMGRLLQQLFEITAQFDMHLRPELVLLQKTMVSVEGVARRMYPTHNLWEAAEPVVKAWISRELSPLAEGRRLFDRLVKRLREEEDGESTLTVANALKIQELKTALRQSQGLGVIAIAASLITLAAVIVLSL